MSVDDKDKGSIVDVDYRSNLLALISHELNTPLTGIVNAISILETESLQNPEYLDVLKRNTERLRETVDSLLELANADAGVYARNRENPVHSACPADFPDCPGFPYSRSNILWEPRKTL